MSHSSSYEITENVYHYNYEATVTANSGYLPGEITVMKNGTKSEISGLLDGDLEVSISEATENLHIDLKERYRYRGYRLTPEQIAEITNPKLIAKEDASGAFMEVKETTIPKIMINTSNVTNMQNMFKNCSNLKSLDLSNFDTSNVTKMYSMFYGCSNLETLDLSNFSTSNMSSMYIPYSIKYLILNNPEVKLKYDRKAFLNPECRILVPKDSLNKYKSDPEWNKIENKIVAMEDYTITRHDNGSIDVTPNNPVNNDPKRICGYIEQIVDGDRVIASHVPYDYTGTIIKSEPLTTNITKEGYSVGELYITGYKYHDSDMNYDDLYSDDIYKEKLLEKYVYGGYITTIHVKYSALVQPIQ